MTEEQIEAQDNMLQSMSVKELKILFSKKTACIITSHTFYSKEQQIIFSEETGCTKKELLLYSMSVENLNNLFKF